VTTRRGPHRDTITLRGVFESFRVHTVTGWGTGMLVPADGGEPIPIKGVIVGGRPGDSVEMDGWWQDHPTYGRQFCVTSCVTTAPQTADAVVAWMASKLPGIGETRARELLAHFGGADMLWRVIETTPERLAEVAGITPDRARGIQATYLQLATERDSMIALKGWGLTDNQIARCCDAWGTIPNVVDHIRTNPYELCFVVHGFGFKRADEVAQRTGIKRDDMHRLVAGVVYTLENSITEGHCYLWGAGLQRMAADVLAVDTAIVGRGIAEAWRRGHIVRRGKRIYSQRLERAEEDCAAEIADLLTSRKLANHNPNSESETRVYH
jgi:exodeoxyribonuclease V alpha subunit